MKKSPLILFLICLVGLISCSKSSPNSRTPPPPGNVNIYAAGNQDSEGIVILRYWKNGIPVNLPCQAIVADGSSLSTTGIVVSGNDVYVSGNDFSPNTNHSVATYWKNGNRVAIGDPSANTYAVSIAVSGNDVYVTGFESRYVSATGKSYNYAVYWKNGNLVILGDTLSISYANSIVVSGNDIYVGGTQYYGTSSVATYWKNGVKTNLTDTSILGYATSVLGSGAEVYPAWVEPNASVGPTIYGTNGVNIPLQGSPNLYGVSSLVAVGNDIYASGYLLDDPFATGLYVPSQAAYWKNGNLFNLSDGTAYSIATSIAISGNDAYVGGRDIAYGGVIWKNGVRTVIPNSFIISAICLTNR